jgi:hypothetical protein
MGPMRPMLREAVHGDPSPGALILAGQLSFAGWMAVSIALHPGFVLKLDEGGISNYGIHLKTVIPYSLAFVLCAYCSIRAGRRYRSSAGVARGLSYLLVTYGCLLLLTLVSTYGYTRDPGLKEAHIAAGVATISFELVAAVWMYAQLRGGWDVLFLGVQVAGFVVAGLTFLGALHLLFVGQALAAVGFGLLLVHLGWVTPCRGQSGSASPDAPDRTG